MIYRITTKAGTYSTTDRDIRSAAWTAIEDQDSREITTYADAWGRGTNEPGRLCVHCPAPDSGDWSGYETDALRVRNERGRVETIKFSATVVWSEDGRTDFFVGYDDADVTRGEWDEPVTAADLLEAAGLSLSEPDVDYAALAEEYISANPDARYYVDDERGFANEWTLIVRSGAERDDEDDDDLREITPEEAVSYIADAVMDRRDYEAIHGCEPYVGAVWQD